MTGGLQSAADMLASYGRGSDTMLAHVSPDEARFIDSVQGGRRTNPATGLPEYSMFGKILKAVARVGATVGAFVLSGGNPAAAAAANAAVTKLTGGSWKQSLTSAAMTFATAGIGNAASGSSMWSNEALKGGAAAGAGAAAGEGAKGLASATIAGLPADLPNVPMGLDSLRAFASEAGNQFGQQAAAAAPSALSAAAPSAAPAFASTADDAIMEAGKQGAQQTALQSALADVGGKTGVMTGLSALATPLNADQPQIPGLSGPPPGFGGNSQIKRANPFHRVYQPYTGDYAHYGEPVSQGGSGGWNFYDEINPAPTYAAAAGGPIGYALGGGVLPPRTLGGGLGGLGMLRAPGIPSQIQSPQMGTTTADRMQARNMSPAAQRDNIRRAAAWGWQNAKNGGPIHGPGTGESDSIPAMLSDGEHVVDKKTVDIMGGGSNARGQKALERMKMRARAQAGMRNPKKPPAFGGA